MNNRLTSLSLILACLAFSAGPAVSQEAPASGENAIEKMAPRPSEIPVDWQLEFDALTVPRPIRFKPPGADSEQTYWYVLFEVANTTEEDHEYVPDFVLYTDTGQILRAQSGVPTGVFKEIKRIYNDPMLLTMTEITGKLLQGRDNAKRGVAIFRDIAPAAGSFNIFVGGLSGETEKVVLPLPIEVQEITVEGKTRTVKKRQVTLTRTLTLQYQLPGEAAARFLTRPRLIRRYWVMR